MLNFATAAAVREVAEQALALAEHGDDAGLLAAAHMQLGAVLFYSGEFAASREHNERSSELFGPGPYRNFWEADRARWSATSPIVISVILGYPDTARNRSEDMLIAARRSSDPAAIAHALQTDNWINRLLGDAPKVLERAEEELAIGTEYGMAAHLMLGAFVHGWALAVQGRAQEGISEMRRFTPVVRLDGFGMLAEGYLAGGRPDEGLEAVSHGLAEVEKSGQRLFEARLYQLNGELLLMQNSSNVEEAESCFRTAIGVARRQGARLFELRATNSLARLLARQGRRHGARAMLAEIYGWFTEGLDTADLKDAKALLDELSV